MLTITPVAYPKYCFVCCFFLGAKLAGFSTTETCRESFALVTSETALSKATRFRLTFGVLGLCVNVRRFCVMDEV
ncbi:hypothetical protein P280DRAFT_468097 [Massarina eburnea CBS 473.64]|uniref:Uncharacterized protein n=1 Tax=Massarina eburnea CBS 473.64 TaxID=1395130 RepID=A0A6A6S8N7_9PLEO|nr:hypothetical protein P280DRAFT_468097 [Massarina eburnea CBS 473.64]